MTDLSGYGGILGLMGGVGYAAFLQTRKAGRCLAARYTWLTVVIGDGVCLLISRLVLGTTEWLTICAIFAVAGIPIIIRSLINDQRDQQEMLNVHTDQSCD